MCKALRSRSRHRRVVAQVEMKAMFDSRLSYFSFMRLVPCAFNLDFIGSTCTDSPSQIPLPQQSQPSVHVPPVITVPQAVHVSPPPSAALQEPSSLHGGGGPQSFIYRRKQIVIESKT